MPLLPGKSSAKENNFIITFVFYDVSFRDITIVIRLLSTFVLIGTEKSSANKRKDRRGSCYQNSSNEMFEISSMSDRSRPFPKRNDNSFYLTMNQFF